MAGEQPRANTPQPEGERRRSRRVVLFIPVELAWTAPDGTNVKEEAVTEEISAHGAVLRMETDPPVEVEAELTNRRTGKSTRARVVRIRDPERDQLTRVIVELDVPSDTFWGVSFPPARRTTQS